MTTPETYLVTLPLRGLALNGGVQPTDVLRRHWMVVGTAQIQEVGELHGSGSSLLSNLLMIAERLRPESFLFVRHRVGQQKTVWDESYAERVLSALSMAILLQPSRWRSSDAPYPQAVFRARYREFCDLPLTFNEERVLAAGHTSRVGLLSVPGQDTLPPLTIDDLDSAVLSAPTVLQAVLAPLPVESREQRLVKGMQVINSAFLGLSAGALVSGFVSAAESLVDTQAVSGQPGERSWTRRLERIKVLAGPNAAQTVDRLIDARHDFVHAAKQPSSDRYPYAALALAAQIWGTITELIAKLKNSQDLEAFLDACADAKRLSGQNTQLGEGLLSSLPLGPHATMDWIGHHLASALP